MKRRSYKGKNNPNYKDGHCIDNRCIVCNKRIHPQAKRCRKCEDKHHAELMIGKGGCKWTEEMKRKASLRLGGTGIPHERDKLKCINCGNEIWRGSMRCTKCSDLYQKDRNHPRFGHRMKPNWKKYNNIWFRSNWEVAYAKYLDKHNIKWLYEPKTFDLGDTTYTPDFYLPKNDTYIEIKGYKSDVFIQKMKLFRKIYIKIKIEIIDKMKLLSLRLINKRGDLIKEVN